MDSLMALKQFVSDRSAYIFDENKVFQCVEDEFTFIGKIEFGNIYLISIRAAYDDNIYFVDNWYNIYQFNTLQKEMKIIIKLK